MEIVIAILFSTVISMGVSLYFRMLGKKDDPLERINKFAIKKTNELNEAFGKIQTRFNTIISDFNAQQTQANAAVKLLKQQNEDFSSKMQTFDQSINAVKTIKTQIDGYAKILSELNDMTAQVEENLERLHKESGVITALDGKLAKQQQQIVSIEKKIPEISKEFSEKNAEQLKSVGTTLIENYESRAAKLASDIKASQGEAEKALGEIRQSIQEAYNHAASSAEKLENTAFVHLSEQAQQRTDQYLKELGAQTASLQAELEKQTMAIRNDITNRTSIIHAELESKSKELSKMFDDKTTAVTTAYKESENKLLTDAKANLIKINEKFNEKLGQLSDAFAGKMDALQTKYNQQLETIGGRNDGLIGKIQARFNEDSNKLEAEYTKQMESIQKKNEGNYSALSAKFDEDFKKFQDAYTAAFENATATNNTKVNEFNRLFVEEHKKFADEHQRLIQDFAAAINESQSENDRKLAEFKDEQNEQLQSLNEIYNAEYTKIKEEYLGRFEGLQDEYAQQIDGLQNVFGNRIEELSNTEEDYKARIENLRSQLEISLRQCNERSTSLQNEISDMQEKLSETLRQVASEATTSVQNAEASVQAIKSQCDEAERKAAELKPELEEKISQMNMSLDSVQSETIEKLERLQNATESKIQEILSETGAKIKDFQTKTEQTITNIQNDSEQQFASLKTDSTAKFESFQSESERQFDGFKGDTTARLDNFQNETNARLESLTKIITDSVRKAVSESEVKHLNILENVDSQLNAYKKDIEYKLSQIQLSESDIDTLEKSLKAAMSEVQNRVLRDFDTFTANQKQKHEEFSNTIKEDSAEIESKITEINRSLDSLKETATGSMSAKLQEFESEFNQTLSTKSDQIDSNLAEWKHELDSKLTTITNTYEDSRKKVEAQYLEDFKTGIEGLQTRASDQYTKVAASIEQTKLDMQDSIKDIQDFVNRFKSDTDNSINSLTKASEEALKKEIEHNKELVQTSLSKLQEDLLGDLKLFEDSVRTRQETGSSSIDAALAEFNTWKQQLKNQFEDSEKIFSTDLEKFKAQSDDKIKEESQKLLQNMNDYAVSVQNQHNELNDKISDLQNQTDASIKSYEEKSAAILNQMGSMYKQMLDEAQKRLAQQDADATERVEAFTKTITEAEDRNAANQSSFTLKMQDSANLIQTRLGEIEKQIQDVKANIQSYETADKMRRQLEANVQELNSAFTKLQGYADTADKMNVQYTSILKINEDINRQLSGMEAQKNRVVSLEQQFGKMMALSSTIDDRILSLNTTKDDLQSMEVTVRNYNDRLQQISEQYERLDKKDEVVTRIMTDVDNQFEKLKELEQRLTNCNRQAVSLPQEIKEVQANVDKILQSGPKITTAIGKLETLDSIITDTEKRIETLNSVQNGIKKTQLDLEGINRDVDNKFNILQKMTQQELTKRPRAKENVINPQINETVRTLKRKGWTIAEIAENVKLTENEVDLILQLPE